MKVGGREMNFGSCEMNLAGYETRFDASEVTLFSARSDISQCENRFIGIETNIGKYENKIGRCEINIRYYEINPSSINMKLNIKQLLRERQIEKPYAFLTKNGISEHVAINLLKDKTDRIQFKNLMQLCRILWCTPDQLFVLDEKDLKKSPLPPNHPLHALLPRPDAPDILKKLRQLPLEKLKEVERLMGEGKGK